ncbi:MAG: helix-turn-helix domain-containing protein [Treponema sp.]|nr:helix-turn-helix domain-containing protein [Treponema sp.]
MGFAENLKAELDYQDIQIKELSQKTGTSKHTIDKYLFGAKAQPGVENAVKIAHILGVSVEYLVEGKSTITEQYPSEYEKILQSYQELNKFNKQTVIDLLKSLSSRQ